MKYRINIQSVSDIITNSSSEVFTIHTGTPAEVIEDWFHTRLKRWGYSEDEISHDSTIRGNIYQESPGVVVISYSVMCNVNESIYDLLVSTFGDGNVQADY